MVYWSRSRQELWRKGETSGDTQTVREAFYDCDGDTLLFKVTQHGRGACHTGRAQLLLHPASTPCRHRPCDRPAWPGSAMIISPSRDEFHSLAATYTVVPVSTVLLADLETPVAAFAKLVGDGDGFLLESVEHGERWGRFSFVGWDPVHDMTLRDGVVAVDGPSTSTCPRHSGILAAIEAVLAAYGAPELADLPPLSGGLIGYLGYDVIREVERLPHVPPSDRGFPDAVMSMIGSLAAFDHWLQRVTLIESVPIHTDGIRRPRCRL